MKVPTLNHFILQIHPVSIRIIIYSVPFSISLQISFPIIFHKYTTTPIYINFVNQTYQSYIGSVRDGLVASLDEAKLWFPDRSGNNKWPALWSLGKALYKYWLLLLLFTWFSILPAILTLILLKWFIFESHPGTSLNSQ